MDIYTLDIRAYLKRLTAAEGERRTPMFADAWLEHWGRIHVALRLYERFRIRFDAFVLHPAEILEALEAQGADLQPADAPPLRLDPADHAPLLPEQQAVAERLLFGECYEPDCQLAAVTTAAERGLEQLPRRNGTIVEPLAHHAWPRSQGHFRRRPA